MIYKFEVPGKIHGKERPRLNRYSGAIYTPRTTKNYEELIKENFLEKYPNFKIIEGRIKIKIIVYFSIPKSTRKRDINDMLENNISPVKRPDIDNIVKVILDSLTKVAFKDDIQVTKLYVEKKYCKEDKLYIFIKQY